MRVAMHDRRDGVEEGERVFAGQLADRAASAGEVRGPVATMTLSQSVRRQARSPRGDLDQRMRFERGRHGGGESRRGRPRARRRPAPG